MSHLKINRVEKNYGAFHAVKGVSLEVEEGEFVVMVGPSGCGKSTLLRCIAGLEPITSGTITVGDHDITRAEPWDRGVAMVFQNYALYPHMTVRDNMGFALKVAGRPKAEIRAAVDKAAQTLRITEHLDKKPKALSGGQKQRVAIGRAITRAPEVFLFDEPLSNLDAALRSQMRVELGRLHNQLGATMIYVTHDQTEAMTMASRIVVLNGGVIEQVGTPLELYNKPESLFVAGFLGSPRMNFFDGRVLESRGRELSVEIPGMPGPVVVPLDDDVPVPQPGAQVRMGVRPEAVTLGGALELSVALVESLGRETLLYLEGGGLRTVDSESAEGFVAVQLPSQHQLRVGEPVKVGWDPASLYLFDDSGRRLATPDPGVPGRVWAGGGWNRPQGRARRGPTRLWRARRPGAGAG
ncbi:probable ABC transporter, ATP-binding protein [Oceanicola granulosus HTCC2516]|uniref:Probable ABC transporter, ATP-binding protein n=1 Tax=Oceanicola granulosus (strain ATCC BAA-861 / DSM 15982 / KCTC 12143 / HTCC2516) TaxID=314256 RepID=Q2CHJ5_OCEGH|nr:ABC transporter ATP-binding protein [Oceanicola granulosus]EAR52044.1 probable ABC transporter, ATP-binding protein [Oceanicola granulosus HTCC2516]